MTENASWTHAANLVTFSFPSRRTVLRPTLRFHLSNLYFSPQKGSFREPHILGYHPLIDMNYPSPSIPQNVAIGLRIDSNGDYQYESDGYRHGQVMCNGQPYANCGQDPQYKSDGVMTCPDGQQYHRGFFCEIACDRDGP
ncbi:hypothetical protein EJ02DRAFT_39394 [Clathrospora elynae]|uniref:Uncharacterized protein n=1 Tax=Clathrospora elynae TaxID=706981 RepID=A0A6A5SBF6_9PLEO|nr:hypothetical protein EJ02DRAFT_39394 [Clathrospora elynae]